MKVKINALIEPSQFSFIQGHPVPHSVATTQEIMTACAKHKRLAFFLKLEFAKAFDTLDWAFLLKVLQARGFGTRWCGWISSLLSLGFFSVLING